MNTTSTTISTPSSGMSDIYGTTEQYRASVSPSRFEAEDEDVATVYNNSLQHFHHQSQTTQSPQNHYFPSPPCTPPEDSQNAHLQSYLLHQPQTHTQFCHLPLPPSPPPIDFESDDFLLPSDDHRNSREIFSMEELNSIFESLAAAVSACGGSDADDDFYGNESYVGGNGDHINDDDICCLVLDDNDTVKLEAALSSMTMT